MLHLRCAALDEPLAADLLAGGKAKIVHFLRHGEAEHQVRARDERERGSVCRCDEPGVAPQLLARCPYLDPGLRDAPLTALGRQQALAAAAPRGVELVLTAPARRALETATLVFPHVPAIAWEELRSRAGRHTHTGRLRRSELVARFPSVDFSALEHEEDTLTAETRRELDVRLARFVHRLLERPERNLALVTHFTVFLTLFQPASATWIVGTNPDRSPLDPAFFDCSGSVRKDSLRAPILEGEARSLVVAPP